MAGLHSLKPNCRNGSNTKRDFKKDNGKYIIGMLRSEVKEVLFETSRDKIRGLAAKNVSTESREFLESSALTHRTVGL